MRTVLLLSLLFQIKSFAAVTSVDKIMDIIDSKNINQVEELLPELPLELRSGFVLVNDSKSLQGATFENPRAIMFGMDAKFIMSFNGDPAQRGYKKLEMIQYNESEAKFDFFDIPFPVQRDENGRALRPQKNPVSCMGCHSTAGQNPHPIWNSYNSWPGVYGAADDFLEGEELARFQNFLHNRKSHERYRALAPLPGSELSPFSYEKRGNYQFRPNLRFGILLSGLQAHQMAKLVGESLNFKKYIALLAYEVDSGLNPVNGYRDCERLYTETGLYGGLWTPEDSKKLYAGLEAERMKYPDRKPTPAKWNMITDLYYQLVPQTSRADWSLSIRSVQDAPEFANGATSFRSHVLWELKDKLYAEIPELSGKLVPLSRYQDDIANFRILRTPFDVAFTQGADRQSMRAGFKDIEHCKILIEKIKKDWITE